MGDNIDEVLTMERNSETYYYHQDGLGSVTDITNASGTVVENYTYSPYGTPSVTTSAIGNPYMFTGRRWDEESEIYYFRARMYDPTIGRFLQRDPIGYYDSMNLYSYVANNSVNWVDPLELVQKILLQEAVFVQIQVMTMTVEIHLIQKILLILLNKKLVKKIQLKISVNVKMGI